MYQTGLFAATYQTPVSRSKQITTSKPSPQKRKRDSYSSDQESADSDATETLSPKARQYPVRRGPEPNTTDDSSNSSDSEELELPKGTFPHAYPNRDLATKLLNKKQLTKELEGLNLDPNVQLDGVQDGILKQQSTLRQQHVTSVVSMLHRCLLQGDYVRASRAWGILLRVEQKRDPRFLRNNGRWGIGAEILLRRHPEVEADVGNEPNTSLGSDSSRQEVSDLPFFPAAFSKNGFEKVKKYFDTLGVLYPPRKRSSNAIDALVFKHAMFGLWIHFAQEHAAVIIQSRRGQTDRDEGGLDRDRSHSENEYSDEELQISQTYLLNQARCILSEVEKLVLKAEFADDKPLCRLRDMTKHWVEDLSSLEPPSSQSEGD